MSFKVVIPARYASARLPGKPLLDIAGRPMIQWVIAAASCSRADEVLVATDDARVAQAAVNPAIAGRPLAVMTGAEHQSGTDRIAEVAKVRGWSADTIVVNVQGDEPQLPPELIDQVAALLELNAAADIATLCTPVASLQEFLDPNVVKVVTAHDGAALYFSRAPIPWHRDGAPNGLMSQTNIQGAQRHLGIYAYRVSALQRLTATPPTDLEVTEKLEQLRALQLGMRIVVAVACAATGIGVDTEHDLARVRAMLGKA
ncbi:MAG TPA: 3-deoxy-manno-octulosonate cytidylyltransferase [Steroidobacteraceae bacterium]|jgi:3-deoxy-manno-octulosonate cytidylyltransferase (CMP-KDO synthetase)